MTRVRAFDDPHYGLKLVRCPGCGRVWTRAKHALLRGSKRARALLTSMVRMLGTVMLLGLVTDFLFLALHSTLDTLAAANLNPYELLRSIGGDQGRSQSVVSLGDVPWTDRTGLPLMFAFCSIASGMILGGSLTHHRLIRLMLGWGGVLVGGFVVVTGGVWLWEALDVELPLAQATRTSGLSRGMGPTGLEVEWAFDMTLGLVASALVAGLGMILGRSLAGVERVWSQRRWRRLRRSRVRRRESR